MKDYVYKLREKPEHIRKQYLYGFMALAMIFVFGVWFLSLSSRYKTVSKGSDYQDLKPISMFGNSIKSLYQDMAASAGNAFVKKENIQDASVEKKMIPLIVIDNNQ
jgi:hypothetical protein